MTETSRARSAGRRFASAAGQTAMAGAGGLVYYGAHSLATPSLYGADAMNIPRRCWIVPAIGIVAGGALSGAPKVGAAGLGLVGGAVAIGAQQVQLAVGIKKNAASAPSTAGVGALLEPGDVRTRALPAQTGEVDETGALWAPPGMQHLVSEAAGIGL
jgi:hypothetical protein